MALKQRSMFGRVVPLLLALLLSLMVVVTFNDIANPILDALR